MNRARKQKLPYAQRGTRRRAVLIDRRYPALRKDVGIIFAGASARMSFTT